jgi:protein-S-isoprenylcysteine O-methyltransferase Ste14
MDGDPAHGARVVKATGVILCVAGGMLALRSALLLAGRGRPRRGPRPQFVIAGPYTRLRNPLLAGAILGLLGVALATQSGALGLAVVAVAIAAHVWVVRVEEPRLRDRFGEAYREYLARVPRWLPRIEARADAR